MARTLTSIPLLNLGILHGYYRDGLCSDFVIYPSAECRTLLAHYKLRLLPRNNGFRLSLQAKPDALGQPQALIPATEIPEGTRFTFFMDLRNPDFNLKTALFEPTHPNPAIRKRTFYFDSRGSAKEMDSGNNWLERVKLYDPSEPPGPNDYPRSFPLSGPLVNYEVEEANPGIVTAELWVYSAEEGENGMPESGLMQSLNKGANNQFMISADLSGHVPGMYTFVLRSGNATVDRRQYYIGAEADRANVFGVVELCKTADWEQAPGEPEIEFSIRFLPLKVVWRYFLVYRSTPFPLLPAKSFLLDHRNTAGLFFKNIAARQNGATKAWGWVKVNGLSGNASKAKEVEEISIDGNVQLLTDPVEYQNGQSLAEFAARICDAVNANPQPFPHHYTALIDSGDNQRILIFAPDGAGSWHNGMDLDTKQKRVNMSNSGSLSGGSDPAPYTPSFEVNGYPAEVFLSQTGPDNPDTTRLPLHEAPKEGLQLLAFDSSSSLDSSNPKFLNRGVPVPALTNGGKWYDPDLNTEFYTKDQYIFI